MWWSFRSYDPHTRCKKYRGIKGDLCRIFGTIIAIVMNMSACDLLQTITDKSKKHEHELTIVSWNLQALFDGVDTGKEYDEYRLSKGWSPEKYTDRVHRLGAALTEWFPDAPDILALQELENKEVLEGLNACFGERKYQYAVFAKHPGFALGVGVLSRYPFQRTTAHLSYGEDMEGQRPILEVVIDTGQGPLVMFVCHWKSKRGKEETEHLRRNSAAIIQRRIRQLFTQQIVPHAQRSQNDKRGSLKTDKKKPGFPHHDSLPAIIVVGDLNENYDEFYRQGEKTITALLPVSKEAAMCILAGQDDKPLVTGGEIQYFEEDHKWIASIPWPSDVLLLQKFQQWKLLSNDVESEELQQGSSSATQSYHHIPLFYSPWEEGHEPGSYWYKDGWETIDHILLHTSLGDGQGWEYGGFMVPRRDPFVDQQGLPLTYSPRTGRGLSDHLPVMTFLKYLDAKAPSEE